MSEVKLYNENCLNVLKTLNDKSIDCIITDPPYRIIPKGGHTTMGGMFDSSTHKIDGKIFINNDIKPQEYANEFYRLLKDDCHCYVMTNSFNMQNMLNAFTDVGFTQCCILVWDKQNKICNQFYMRQIEFIIMFRKNNPKAINNCGDSNLISIPNKKIVDENGKNLHDTEKPIKLMEIFVLNSTNENDVVLDPFMGIGSTGIACKKNNRNFIGCEIDKKYFDIAESRINDTFGKITIDDGIFGL